MANIFKQQKEVNNHAKRNNFDLSFQNHLSMNMGTLYPVFCKEVVPGDSFRINAAFGLKFMPLAFPVQSRLRANLQFFYVRNKNLWNKWENWISNLEGAEENVIHPYIYKEKDFFKTGSLSDYLNVPTTLAVAGSTAFELPAYYRSVAYLDGSFYRVPSLRDQQPFNGYPMPVTNSTGINASSYDFYYLSDISGSSFDHQRAIPTDFSAVGFLFGWYDREIGLDSRFVIPFVGATPQRPVLHVVFRRHCSTNTDEWYFGSSQNSIYNVTGTNLVFAAEQGFNQELLDRLGMGYDIGVMLFDSGINSSEDFKGLPYCVGTSLFARVASSSIKHEDFDIPFSREIDAMRISALPYRAYESIYNCYYRNTVNQPFIVGSKKVYNQYNTTLEGGADTTDYVLYRRNYELDFLTSALPSPQQGNAPLIGITNTGHITVEDESGLTTAQAQVDDDGNIVGINVTSPVASKEHNIELARIAEMGINVNDIRNSNSLLHWLETNIRKGYRYIDFITGHFGKAPKYNELDMPEFIGGFSRDVNVSQIVSTADTLGDGGAGLGQFQGMASCFGGSKHSITHYCDDYGFIMGILCVVPTPAYSQLLPKQFLKQSPLDYYFPEFSQLGMQPITYEEVCPIQAFYNHSIDNTTPSIHDTFGYQRPNYDLVSNVDEIHGDFRGDLHHFLINRVFGSSPVLGNDFLQIDPDETNQIFVDEQNNDNIIGQVVFDVKAKRPIPRVVIPSLGR